MRRLAALAAASVLAVGVPLAVSPSAAVAADPGCTADNATIVAVDFGHWGGPIVRGCAVGAKTGAALLDDADFLRTGTQHDGPAFICRLGNEAFDHGAQYPTPSSEPCTATPPASAYWSYWLAPRGQHSWSYSQLGAYSDIPKAGEVQLWHFGGTNIEGNCGSGVPPYSPDALRGSGVPSGGDGGVACKSEQDKDEALGRNGAGGSGGRTGSGGSGGGSGGSHGSGGHHRSGTRGVAAGSGDSGGGAHPDQPRAGGATSSAAGAGTKPTSSAAAPTAPGTTVTSAGATSSTAARPTTAGSGGPTIVDARPASADTKRPSTGSLLPVLLGVALAVLLAVGTGWTVLRRKRGQV